MIALDARPFLGLRFDEGYKSGVWNMGSDGQFTLSEAYAAGGIVKESENESEGGDRNETDSGVVERADNNDSNNKKRRPPVRFRGAMRDKQECAASECKLIAKDFWKRHFDRWVVSSLYFFVLDIISFRLAFYSFIFIFILLNN